MTQNAVTKCASATLFLLVLLLLIALLSDAAYQFDQPPSLKETNIVFYMHDWQNGLNATAIPVGGSQKKPWSAVEFGTIFAIDDKLMVASDRSIG
ncbi:hypothetical protein Ddye_017024 [Dipteronia dyeriana]|uniref:Dirigent protein n=1 Tax=Dipteronia dyeriana TaxID=168575 RepID=A0AAD9U7W6_9ROSI|nr:hypothetical protein Ddye_017024 [Dipteronia dyeriana]